MVGGGGGGADLDPHCFQVPYVLFCASLTLLHSGWPKLHGVWSFGRSESNRVK